MAASPVKEQLFRISDVPVHELPDPKGWYKVRLAFGPRRQWRTFGPGRWEHDHDETLKAPAGEVAPIIQHYRLSPAIAEIDHLDGGNTCGLVVESNEWLAVNRYVEARNTPLYNRDNGQKLGTINQAAQAADVGRMLVVLSVEESTEPPELAASRPDYAGMAAAMVKALLDAGVLAAPKGK
jgi:hypothetical protein